MNAFWSNYLFTAERYIRGDTESFAFVSYENQQAYNEREIEQECAKLGTGEETLNVLRQFYNAQVVLYKREPTPETFDFAMSLLAQFNDELAQQNKAAATIQHTFKARNISDTGTYIAEDECYGVCAHCSEPRMGCYVNLCADCYWDDDAAYKRNRRLVRQNAMTPR
jgi:hypothetical protein